MDTKCSEDEYFIRVGLDVYDDDCRRNSFKIDLDETPYWPQILLEIATAMNNLKGEDKYHIDTDILEKHINAASEEQRDLFIANTL